MRTVNWMLLAVVMCASTPTLKSQQLVVNMDKAIEIALSESPTVQVADKEVERKRYAKKEAVAKLIPSVNASASYGYAIEKQKMTMRLPNQEPMSIAVGSDNSYNFGVQASVPLVAPTLWQNLNVTEVDIERSIEAARTSRLNMVKSVKNSFNNVLLSENSLDVIQRNYEQAVENLKATEERYKVGAASEYDFIRAEVQVRNLEPNVYQAESAVRSSYLQLKALLGFDADVELLVDGEFEGVEKDMYRTLLTVDSVSLAENPNLRQLDMEIKYMESNLKMQKMQRIPTLSLGANYNYLTTLANGWDFSTYSWSPYSSINLSLSIPIFEGLAKSHREKQTRIGIESMQIQKVDTERQLITQKQVCIDNIKKCIKQVESSKKGMASAEKGRDIAQKRYDLGAGSFLEYNDAEVALLQAQLSFNQALFNFLSAKADLENLAGTFPVGE